MNGVTLSGSEGTATDLTFVPLATIATPNPYTLFCHRSLSKNKRDHNQFLFFF
jgi:hypothetical protein